MNTNKHIIITIALALVFLGYLGYEYYTLKTKFTATTSTLASTTATLQTTQDDLNQRDREVENLTNLYLAEKRKNDDFQNQIESIADTVSDLEKLKSLDPELLKKYSKISFLNENYNPTKLRTIDSSYVVNGKEMYIHTQVWPFLKKMMDAAARAGSSTKLQIISGYRSFDTQSDLKSNYKVVYGTGANQFSADQGYSEHQLGTAVDLNTPSLGGTLETTFENTVAFKWLEENAYKYGFVLSYPKGNAYYQYEPWHWRFVGTDLAGDLHRKNKNFYDLDQREIDSYLISIFD